MDVQVIYSRTHNPLSLLARRMIRDLLKILFVPLVADQGDKEYLLVLLLLSLFCSRLMPCPLLDATH